MPFEKAIENPELNFNWGGGTTLNYWTLDGSYKVIKPRTEANYRNLITLKTSRFVIFIHNIKQ